jgi:hypothetical protein
MKREEGPLDLAFFCGQTDNIHPEARENCQSE